MSLKKVLYTGPRHSGEKAQEILKGKYEVIFTEASPADLLPKLYECDVFLDASMKVNISASDIEKAKNLKLIVTATTGASHIDQDALKSKNIPLLTLKGQTQVLHQLTPAAELSWLLLMSCARKFRAAIHHVDQGEWNRESFPGIMLNGRTIGIIGFGRLGSWMARYAKAFGMTVLVHDPFNKEVPEGIQWFELKELVAKADFISLHVHLSPETTGMINKEVISKFKSESIFINTSRAQIVDNNALIEALKSGQIAGVGVDVLDHEPDVNNDALWQYAQGNENVIISPHIGGFSPQAVDTVVGFSAERILSHFNS